MGLAQTAGDNGPSTEAGGLGGTLSDIMGTTNHYHVSAPKLNAGNYQFQSDDPSQTGLNAQGLAGQGRGGVQVDTTGINRDYGYQNQSRNQGEQLISQLQDQAAGRGPSLATMQFNQNRDQSIMAGQSMANSARGGQNLGMSQYQAQVGAGQAMQQASAGSAAMRMQEQLSARQQLAGAIGQQRSQDLQNMGMSAQQAQYQANLEAQQRQQNDAYQLGSEGMANQIGFANQQGGIGYEGANQSGSEWAQGINSGIAAGNTAAAGAAMKMVGNAALGAATGGTSLMAGAGAGMIPGKP